MHLELQNVSKTFRRTRALTNVSLSVPPSSIVALLGENGAGKSTLLRILAGVCVPDSGLVRYDGKVFSRENTPLRKRLHFTPDMPLLFPDQTVARNIATFAALYEQPTVGREEFLTHWLEETGSAALMRRTVALLSRGQIWKAGLGCVAAIEPDRYRAVLVNLPISGEHVLRWARSRFFIQKWFSILCFSVLCSLSLSNFSWASPWQLATTTLLLFATVVATVILLDDSWLGRFRIVKIWTIVSLLLIGWMTVLFFTHRRIFRIGGTPEWMADGIQNITWLFPPSWSLPGRLEQGGVYLATIWIGIGAMRWLAWPKLSAPHFDAPQDFVETFGDFAYQEDDDGEFGGRDPKPAAGEIDHLAVAVDAEPKAVKTNRHIRIPKPLAMAAGGWVDRWIRRVVGESNAALAGALTDPSHTNTRKTNRVIVWSPVWLAVTWAITEFYPESDSKELIILWIRILSPALLILGLLPFSNAIPRATAAWNLGSQSMPFFTACPVGTRDLLRLSLRITLARCIVMALIATPLCWLLLVILAPEDTPWVACWLVPAFCFFWATSRPILVWYRLQAATRRRRGALLSHALGVSLSIALAIVWLVSGAAGVISGLGYFLGGTSGSDRWLLPALAVGGLFLSGLTARAVFEIHRWQLSRRHFDWVSSE